MVKYMEETLILTTSSNKKELLKKNSRTLSRKKYMTFQELKEKLFFSYDERAIYEVMKKENVSLGIAKIYLDNLYFLDGSTPKIDKLRNIYNYLNSSHLLIKNELFSSFFKRQKILVYSNGILSNEEKQLLENTSYEMMEFPFYNNRKIPLYVHSTLDEEVHFLARECMKLLKSGVLASKIKVVNVNDEYRMSISKIFNWYHIPNNIEIPKSIYGTSLVKQFLSFDNVEEGLEEIEKQIHTEEENQIFDSLLSILNRYRELPQDSITRTMIIEELKKTTIPVSKLKNVVEEGSIETIYDDSYYVFVIGFNQGVLPIIHKEENYLSDQELKSLGRSTSNDRNVLEKESVKSFLYSTKNIILSYKKKTLTDTYYPSSLLEEIELEEKEVTLNYQDSHLANLLFLGKMLDNHYKYHVSHKDLELLYGNYSTISYRTYSNHYQYVPKEKIREALENKLLLSYSSMDNYYRCSFRYYLEKVLKLNLFESTFLQEIGNLFHYVLSKAFLDTFDFEQEWNNYLEENAIIKSKKDEFFLKRLKEELKFIIEEIKRQYRYSSFDGAFYEEKIYTNPTLDANITFMGIIDKLLYQKKDNLVSVIDYKTGNPHLNLETLPYGIDMQLPVYLYLVNHFSKIENPKIVGFYLQKILHNEISRKENSTYENEKRKNLYLQGYSTSNEFYLKEFDSSYEESCVIKGLRKSSKGFYAYSKVLSDKEMGRIISIVDSKIKEAITNIWEGNFSINPKRIGFEKVGCQYCPYQDICYHTEKDVVNLKEYQNLDFLGGEENAELD